MRVVREAYAPPAIGEMVLLEIEPGSCDQFWNYRLTKSEIYEFRLEQDGAQDERPRVEDKPEGTPEGESFHAGRAEDG